MTCRSSLASKINCYCFGSKHSLIQLHFNLQCCSFPDITPTDLNILMADLSDQVTDLLEKYQQCIHDVYTGSKQERDRVARFIYELVPRVICFMGLDGSDSELMKMNDELNGKIEQYIQYEEAAMKFSDMAFFTKLFNNMSLSAFVGQTRDAAAVDNIVELISGLERPPCCKLIKDKMMELVEQRKPATAVVTPAGALAAASRVTRSPMPNQSNFHSRRHLQRPTLMPKELAPVYSTSINDDLTKSSAKETGPVEVADKPRELACKQTSHSNPCQVSLQSVDARHQVTPNQAHGGARPKIFAKTQIPNQSKEKLLKRKCSPQHEHDPSLVKSVQPVIPVRGNIRHAITQTSYKEEGKLKQWEMNQDGITVKCTNAETQTSIKEEEKQELLRAFQGLKLDEHSPMPQPSRASTHKALSATHCSQQSPSSEGPQKQAEPTQTIRPCGNSTGERLLKTQLKSDKLVSGLPHPERLSAIAKQNPLHSIQDKEDTIPWQGEKQVKHELKDDESLSGLHGPGHISAMPKQKPPHSVQDKDHTMSQNNKDNSRKPNEAKLLGPKPSVVVKRTAASKSECTKPKTIFSKEEPVTVSNIKERGQSHKRDTDRFPYVTPANGRESGTRLQDKTEKVLKDKVIYLKNAVLRSASFQS